MERNEIVLFLYLFWIKYFLFSFKTWYKMKKQKWTQICNVIWINKNYGTDTVIQYVISMEYQKKLTGEK